MLFLQIAIVLEYMDGGSLGDVLQKASSCCLSPVFLTDKQVTLTTICLEHVLHPPLLLALMLQSCACSPAGNRWSKYFRPGPWSTHDRQSPEKSHSNDVAGDSCS